MATTKKSTAPKTAAKATEATETEAPVIKALVLDQYDDDGQLVAKDGSTVTETMEASDIHGTAGELVQVTADKLAVNPDINPTDRLKNAKNLDNLATSIFTRGLQEPIAAYAEKGKDGTEYVILRGHRRHAAILHAQEHFGLPADTLFNVQVVPKVTADDSAIDTLASNTGEGHTPLELGELFRRAKAAGHSNAHIARVHCVTPGIVSHWLKLDGLPPEVKELVRDKTMTAKTAVEGKRLIDSRKAEEGTTADQKKALSCKNIYKLSLAMAEGETAKGKAPRVTIDHVKAMIAKIMGDPLPDDVPSIDWPHVVDSALEALPEGDEADVARAILQEAMDTFTAANKTKKDNKKKAS